MNRMDRYQNEGSQLDDDKSFGEYSERNGKLFRFRAGWRSLSVTTIVSLSSRKQYICSRNKHDRLFDYISRESTGGRFSNGKFDVRE